LAACLGGHTGTGGGSSTSGGSVAGWRRRCGLTVVRDYAREFKVLAAISAELIAIGVAETAVLADHCHVTIPTRVAAGWEW